MKDCCVVAEYGENENGYEVLKQCLREAGFKQVGETFHIGQMILHFITLEQFNERNDMVTEFVVNSMYALQREKPLSDNRLQKEIGLQDQQIQSLRQQIEQQAKKLQKNVKPSKEPKKETPAKPKPPAVGEGAGKA